MDTNIVNPEAVLSIEDAIAAIDRLGERMEELSRQICRANYQPSSVTREALLRMEQQFDELRNECHRRMRELVDEKRTA